MDIFPAEPLLPDRLDLPPKARARLQWHFEHGGLRDPSASAPRILLEEFGLDLRAQYGPIPIAHPIGKASGQLSLQPRQVQADAEAGLAFVVLKTVIAEDERGAATMEAWKIKEPRMVVEPIVGRRSGREGWTVSWAGRGWEGSLESYARFLREALEIGAARAMPVIPSCKFNLPAGEGEPFARAEYLHTLGVLEAAWRAVRPGEPLALEQDFSPTLAGAGMAGSRAIILRWLEQSPALIKEIRPGLLLGVKLMNAMFDDRFQLEMMERVSRRGGAADFLVCFNRLFDPQMRFGQKRGIAYGGPDLGDRNLAVLGRAIHERRLERDLPISATGDILTGKWMAEYALRGATSGQLHTLFQLPAETFALKGASRPRAAAHEIFFHPETGLAAAMLHAREKWKGGEETIAFMELGEIGRREVEKRENEK